LQTIRSILFNLLLYTSVIFISTFIIVLFPFISTVRLQRFSSIWIHFILNSLKFLCGVTWRIEGLNNLPNKACILVSNHQGAWESFFLQTLYHPSSSIIKKELLYIPLFGWALACLKPIYIKRSNKLASLKKVIKDGSDKLKGGYFNYPISRGDKSDASKGSKTFF
jgi:1-acyl-sn-glycerol-3-phosphate acyltransferase